MLRLFFVGYFNDILAGLVILTLTNLLLTLAGLRPLGGISAVLFVLLCGLFWELAPLLYKPAAVCDPWDLAAYLAGCGAYLLLAHVFKKNAAP